MSAQPRGTPTSSKGVRYLGLLDQALCNGNWSDVPELARKVEKHVPERRGLTTAARAEVQIASASHRPGSAASSTATSLHALAELLPKLKEASSAEQTRHADDVFIVNNAIAKIYWLQEDPTEALALLGRQDPTAVTNASRNAGTAATTLGWLEVCSVQSTLIKAECLNATARSEEAMQVYRSAAAQTPGYRTPELRKWTERLLARACMYNVKKVPTSLSPDLGETYNVFKAWNLFWQRTPLSHGGESESSFLDIPRTSVWKAYYDLLSTILAENFIFNPTAKSPRDLLRPYSNDLPQTQRILTRRAQYAELRNVETTYENLLLTETRFPRSDQHNSIIESWVDQVMANWSVLTSAAWSDADIGEGGRTTVSRCALSILYRAATKTFHSTTILRHLFTVHASLEEFDLAMHAFDSYADIVDRGKAREEKTGQHEAGIDDDSIAVETAAHAIRVLCRYGDRQQIEKAAEIGKVIQKWLGHQDLETTREDLEVNHVQEKPALESSAIFKAATLGTAYRALGISQAESAHLTHEKRDRSELFKAANDNLRRAQKLDGQNIRTTHALALVLAETRDVAGAIKVIKSAIAREQQSTPEDGAQILHRFATHAPSLVSVWHLLALCLTSKDEHEAAMQVCETAFEQFGNIDSLIGHAASASPGDNAEPRLPGAFEALDGPEKECLIQIKLTQIALVELTEGPEEAVDQADELLSLYSRLFGYPKSAPRDSSRPPATAASTNTQRRGGPLRSVTGSIRPRSVKSTNRTSDEKDALTQHSLLSANTLGAVEENANGQSLGSPIEITVTNENGIPAKKQHEHYLHLPHMPKLAHLHLRDSNSASDPQTAEGVETSTDEKAIASSLPLESTVAAQPEKDALHAAPEPNSALGLTGRASQLSASHSILSGSSESSINARKHAISLLVNIFTFIAEIFTRAQLFDDAQNAIDDAKKWTSTFEAEVSKAAQPATARSFFSREWGCGKSADELWADIWSAKAQLSKAQDLPFEAMANYEEALSYVPDHAVAIVGISNILMDIFEEKMPAEEPLHPLQPLPLAGGTTSLITEARPALTRPNSSANGAPSSRPISQINVPTVADELPPRRRLDPSPAELNRLAARDRAYMLLRNLSTTGHGWDDSEAWFALARAHELSREIAKAKAALWWVVELENLRPVREWKVASPGGYAL